MQTKIGSCLKLHVCLTLPLMVSGRGVSGARCSLFSSSCQAITVIFPTRTFSAELRHNEITLTLSYILILHLLIRQFYKEKNNTPLSSVLLTILVYTDDHSELFYNFNFKNNLPERQVECVVLVLQ